MLLPSTNLVASDLSPTDFSCSNVDPTPSGTPPAKVMLGSFLVLLMGISQVVYAATYVATTGSDDHVLCGGGSTCGASGAPCRTIHCGWLVGSANDGVVILQSGTYKGNEEVGAGGTWLETTGTMVLQGATGVASDVILLCNSDSGPEHVVKAHSGGYVTVSHLTIRNCTSSSSGGGLVSRDTGTLFNAYNVHLELMHTDDSGGGAAVYQNASMVLQFVEFTQCTASKKGGGIIVFDEANLLAQSCTFYKCETLSSSWGSWGGGCMVEGSVAVAVFEDSHFEKCDCTHDRGVCIASYNESSVYIYRTHFVDNYVNDGDLYVYGANMHVENCTIEDGNYAFGMIGSNSVVYVRDTIVHNSPSNLLLSYGGTIYFENLVYEGRDFRVQGGDVVWIGNNVITGQLVNAPLITVESAGSMSTLSDTTLLINCSACSTSYAVIWSRKYPNWGGRFYWSLGQVNIISPGPLLDAEPTSKLYFGAGTLQTTGSYAALVVEDTLMEMNHTHVRGTDKYLIRATASSEVLVGPHSSVGYVSGGCILVTDSSLTVDGAFLTQCNASEAGGAIRIENSNVSIVGGAVIEQCNATGGGGIYVFGDSHVWISDSTFQDNQAMLSGSTACVAQERGGADILALNGAEVTLSNAQMLRSRGWRGGSIHAVGATVILANGTLFQDTYGTTYGGAMYGCSATFVSSGAIMERSIATSGGAIFLWTTELKGSDLLFKDCSSSSGGGGIRLFDNAILNMSGVTMESVASGDGGGIFSSYGGTVVLDQARFSSCGGSGCIHIHDEATIEIENSWVNATGSTGPFVFAMSSLVEVGVTDLRIKNVTLVGESSAEAMLLVAQGSSDSRLNVTLTNIYVQDAVGEAVVAITTPFVHTMWTGGCVERTTMNQSVAVFRGGAEATLSHVEFVDCHSNSRGGAILIEEQHTRVAVEDCTFLRCSAGISAMDSEPLDGGGAIAVVNQGYILLDNATLIECHSTMGDGGGIAILDHSLADIQDSVLDGCIAERGGGGLIFGTASNGTMVHTLVTNCVSNFPYGSNFRGGGGVSVRDTCMFQVSGSTFQGCSANGTGGSLLMAGHSVMMLNMTDCVVEQSTSSGMGGGLTIVKKFGDHPSMLIGHSLFRDCSAADSFGGGIMIAYETTDATVTHVRVENCSAKFGGGIATLQSSFDLQHVEIDSCSSSLHGGCIHAQPYNNANMLMSNISMSNCIAEDQGGGLYCSYPSALDVGLAYTGELMVHDVSVESSRGLYGGGIYISSHCNATFTGSTLVRECNSTFRGGGLFVGNHFPLSIPSTVVVVGPFTVENVRAGTRGGAIYVADEGVSVHCSGVLDIAQASATMGGCVYVQANGSLSVQGGGTWTGCEARVSRAAAAFVGTSGASRLELYNVDVVDAVATSVVLGGAVYCTDHALVNITDCTSTNPDVGGRDMVCGSWLCTLVGDASLGVCDLSNVGQNCAGYGGAGWGSCFEAQVDCDYCAICDGDNTSCCNGQLPGHDGVGCRCPGGLDGDTDCGSSCPVDTWSATGDYNCTLCDPHGSTNGTDGCAQLDDCRCDAGWWMNGVCEMTTAGWWSPDWNNSRFACPSATWSGTAEASSDTVCTECSAGTASLVVGRDTDCDVCGDGEYSGVGASVCLSCHAYRPNSTTVSGLKEDHDDPDEDCRECVVGHYLLGDLSACVERKEDGEVCDWTAVNGEADSCLSGHCVDGYCCESACGGVETDCMECRTTPGVCVNHTSQVWSNCTDQPCASRVQGLSGASCISWVDNSDGWCDASGSCADSTSVAACNAAVTTDVVMSCGSAACVRPGQCQSWDLRLTYTVKGNLCVLDDSPVNGCPALPCDDYVRGWNASNRTCEGWMTPHSNGWCNSTGGCVDLDSEGCDASSGLVTIAECADSACAKTCTAFALIIGSTVSEVCYDDGDQGNCALDRRCDAIGACLLRVGQSCGVNSDCYTNYCVDGFCCESACGGGDETDCMECRTTPGSCVNHTSQVWSNCTDQPCASRVQGLSGASCISWVDNSDGWCDASGSCADSTSVVACNAAVTTDVVMSCGSAACVRPGQCQSWDLRLTYTVKGNLCVLDDSPVNGCPALPCDDFVRGWHANNRTCEGWMTPHSNGWCNSTGGCVDLDSEGCDASSGLVTIAECADSACAKTCTSFALITGSTASEVCYDDGDQGNCALDRRCDAIGACLLRVGQSCGVNSDCYTNYCVDGFCCESACGGGDEMDCLECRTTPGSCTNHTNEVWINCTSLNCVDRVYGWGDFAGLNNLTCYRFEEDYDGWCDGSGVCIGDTWQNCLDVHLYLSDSSIAISECDEVECQDPAQCVADDSVLLHDTVGEICYNYTDVLANSGEADGTFQFGCGLHAHCNTTGGCACDRWPGLGGVEPNTGWSGSNCDVPVCSQGCVHGDCDAPDNCNCTLFPGGGLMWRNLDCGLCLFDPTLDAQWEAPQGVLEDGSGLPLARDADCMWTISNASFPVILLTATEFSLAPGDLLEISNGTNVLRVLVGNDVEVGDVIVVAGDEVNVHLVTTSSGPADTGFGFTWDTDCGGDWSINSAPTPWLGPKEGGTIVTVHGWFPSPCDPSTIHCYFGGVQSPQTTYVNPTTIECVKLPGAEGLMVNLTITGGSNAEAYNATVEEFEYWEDAIIGQVYEVMPNVATVGQGPLNITVHALPGTLWEDVPWITCRVTTACGLLGSLETGCTEGDREAQPNPVVFPAIFITSTELLCPHVELLASSELTIAPNGQQYPAPVVYDKANSLGAIIHNRPLPTVSDSVPRSWGINGSETGETVAVIGSGFIDTPSLRCVFGDTTTIAQYSASVFVRCPVPAHVAGSVMLRLSNSGDQHIPNATYGISFTYTANPAKLLLVTDPGTLTLNAKDRPLDPQPIVLVTDSNDNAIVVSPTADEAVAADLRVEVQAVITPPPESAWGTEAVSNRTGHVVFTQLAFVGQANVSYTITFTGTWKGDDLTSIPAPLPTIMAPCSVIRSGSTLPTPNTTNIGSDLCACAPGYELDGLRCLKCVRDFWKDTVDDSSCTPCGQNEVTNGTGSDSIFDCTCALNFGRDAQGNCRCLEGYGYVASANPPTCERCPLSTFKPPGVMDLEVCRSCPSLQETRNVGQTKCVCEQDAYRSFDDPDLCIPCPPNGLCEGGEMPPVPLDGTWQGDDDPLAFHSCPLKGSCLGGGPVNCSEGYTGPVCAVCADGYFQSGGQCLECAAGQTTNIATMSGVVFLAFVAFLIRSLRKRYQKKSSHGSGIGKLIRSMISILVGFVQILNSFGSSYSIPWPTAVTSLYSSFSFVDLDVIQMTGGDCGSTPITFIDSMVITTMLPIGILFLMLVWYWIALWKGKRAARKAGLASIPQDDKHALRNKVLHAAVFFLLLVYPPLSSKIMRFFDCRELNGGTMWLKADYRVECLVGRWNTFVPYVIVMVVLFPVGIPLFLGSALFRNRKRLARLNTYHAALEASPMLLSSAEQGGSVNLELKGGRRASVSIDAKALTDPTFLLEAGDLDVDARWRFLVNKYVAEAWWWELLELWRKLLLTSLLIFIAYGSTYQVGLGLLICALFLGMQLKYHPFRKSALQSTQTWSLTVLSLALFIGLMFRAEPSTSEEVGMLVPLLVASVFVVGLYQLIKELRKRKKVSVRVDELLEVVEEEEEDEKE